MFLIRHRIGFAPLDLPKGTKGCLTKPSLYFDKMDRLFKTVSNYIRFAD
jgi:hypothetical protein